MTPRPNALGLAITDMAAAVASYGRLGLRFAASVLDPDGNAVDLYADLPAAS